MLDTAGGPFADRGAVDEPVDIVGTDRFGRRRMAAAAAPMIAPPATMPIEIQKAVLSRPGHRAARTPRHGFERGGGRHDPVGDAGRQGVPDNTECEQHRRRCRRPPERCRLGGLAALVREERKHKAGGVGDGEHRADRDAGEDEIPGGTGLLERRLNGRFLRGSRQRWHTGIDNPAKTMTQNATGIGYGAPTGGIRLRFGCRSRRRP